MVAKLVFQLPEDNFDFKLATKSTDMFLTISEMKDFLKREQSISKDSGDENRFNTIQSIRDYLWDLLQEKELVNLINS